MQKLKDKGQADLGIAIATAAIVLVITVIVIGQLLPVGLVAVGGDAKNYTNAYAVISNITGYTWTGVQLAAIGLIIMAGFGIIGYMVLGRR